MSDALSRFEDRPYQRDLVEQTREALDEGLATILQLATGGGKTHCAAMLIKAEKPGPRTRALIMAPRQEIIRQTRDALARHGIEAGILLASESKHTDRRVIVASPETIDSRGLPENVRLVIVDECHHATKRTARQIGDLRKAAPGGRLRVVGLSATPCRTNGHALRDFGWQRIIKGPSVVELVKLCALVAPELWSHDAPDMSKAKIVSGDYQSSAAERAMSSPKIIGDAVAHYKRHAAGRRAVGFAVNRKHGRTMAEAFRKAGITSEFIDATTPNDERRDAIERLASGETLVLWNVDLIGMGWDLPELEVLIECRPTTSLALWLQHIGRVMRPCGDGSSAIVLDHAGNYRRHGGPLESIEWTLDGAIPQTRCLTTRCCRTCHVVFDAALERCPKGCEPAEDESVNRPDVVHARGKLVNVEMVESAGEDQEQDSEYIDALNALIQEAADRKRRYSNEDILELSALLLAAGCILKVGRMTLLRRERGSVRAAAADVSPPEAMTMIREKFIDGPSPPVDQELDERLRELERFSEKLRSERAKVSVSVRVPPDLLSMLDVAVRRYQSEMHQTISRNDAICEAIRCFVIRIKASTPDKVAATRPSIAVGTISAPEAAVALSISERQLWTLTNNGTIPCVRIGKRVLYSSEVLREWLSEQARRSIRPRKPEPMEAAT